jgi:hypothetical protein
MLNENYTLQTKQGITLNVSSYLVVSCTKQVQEVTVARRDDEKSWIRLAKLEYPYGITELCQKDQNNYLIWKNYSCPAQECNKMLGTCIHGEIPEIYHPGYLDDWKTQVRLLPPKPQEKILVGPSPEVSSAILKGNVERRTQAHLDSLAEENEAKNPSVPKEKAEGESALKVVPKQLNMDEGATTAVEDCPKGPNELDAEDEENNIPQDP